MTCNELSNDRLLEALTADEREHLSSCAACSARSAELRSLANRLRAVAPPLPEPDPALVRRILGRLRTPPRRIVHRQGLPGRWIAAAAAVLAVAIVLVLATRQKEIPDVEVGGLPPEKPALETILDPVPPPPVSPALPQESRTPDPVTVPRPATLPLPEAPRPGPVRPAPRSDDPAPTPPPTTEPRQPSPAPTDVRPLRVHLAVLQTEGAPEIGGKKIERGAEWDKGGILRTGERLSRVVLGDGTRLSLHPHAEVRLDAAEMLALESGEVYFEVVPAAGRNLTVLTPDAAIQAVGTAFSAKRTDHTEIVVTAGDVRVSNEKGEVLVSAGNGTVVRRLAAPAKPRAVDVDAMTLWRRPAETARFHYDFEDNRKPVPWENGRVVPGPARGFNKNCLEGSPGINLNLSRVDRRVGIVKGSLKVRFRYFAPEGDMLWVQLFDDRVQDNFRFQVTPLPHGKWEMVEAPLSDFFLLIDGAAKIQEGDRLSWFNISVSGTKGPVYFDDIELTEVAK